MKAIVFADMHNISTIIIYTRRYENSDYESMKTHSHKDT